MVVTGNLLTAWAGLAVSAPPGLTFQASTSSLSWHA